MAAIAADDAAAVAAALQAGAHCNHKKRHIDMWQRFPAGILQGEVLGAACT